MFNLIFYFLFITIILIIIFYSWLCYNFYYHPAKLVNLNYECKYNIDNYIKEPTLILVDHSYDIISDIMFIFDQTKNSKNKYSLVAKPNKLKSYFESFICPVKHELIMVENKNTVKKCIENLKNKTNVVIFLKKEDSDRNGIYYILKETQCKLLLINKKINKIEKINYFNNKFLEKIFRKKNIDFNMKKFDKYPGEKNEFKDWIKKKLFI